MKFVASRKRRTSEIVTLGCLILKCTASNIYPRYTRCIPTIVYCTEHIYSLGTNYVFFLVEDKYEILAYIIEKREKEKEKDLLTLRYF